MKIKKDNSIGILIDIQERLFPHIFENEKLLKNTVTLVKGLKLLGVPILVTEQYVKGLGPTIEDLKKETTGDSTIEKITFSCCDEARFNMELNLQNRTQVLLFGTETHICVLQTAIDLKESGFQPIIVTDCTSSRKLQDREIAFDRFKTEGITLTTYESVLFELCGSAGTDTFKNLSKLVK